MAIFFTGLAGLFYAKAGFKDKKITDGVLGVSTFAAGLTSALVKEKAPDPDQAPPKTVFGKAWKYIEERPNRVAGFGYMLATIIHGGEALKSLLSVKNTDFTYSGTEKFQFRDPKKWAYIAHSMRLAFAGINVVDEIILAFASKGHGDGVKSDKGVDDTSYAIVADAIVRQPEKLQPMLIHDLSNNFLARRDVLGGDATYIENALRQRVKNLAKILG